MIIVNALKLYNLDILISLSGCVADDTENSSLACIQIAFRYYHDDDLAVGKRFIYGPSKSNIVSYEFSVYTISNYPDIYVQV